MSRLRKVLSIFMILAVMLFTSSLSVFVMGAATSPGGNTTPQTSETETSAIPGVPPSSSTPSSAVKSALPSSKPASSSAVSSKPKRQEPSSTVSSAVSSDLAGGVSSELSSEEESSSSQISLPSVGSVSEADPLSSAAANTDEAQKTKWIGIISWSCIALGVLVVLIVVLTNRRPPRGMGRKRYRRSKRSNGKHLLNDRYYRNINR